MEQTKNEPKFENKAAPDNGKPKNRRQAESHQACLNGQGAKEEGKAKERKPLTEAQRLKRQKMIVLPAMVLVFIGAMWLIFAPSSDKKQQPGTSGYNMEMPDADKANCQIIGDKAKAYEHGEMEERQENRSRAMQQLGDLFDRETAAAGQTAEPSPVQKAGKNTAAPVRQVTHQVVSSLSQPMSNAEFVASFSQERNRSFNTAVGVTTVSDRNTIPACVYGAQSVTDGQAVRLRLLEPMAVADRIIPRNAVVVGAAKIQGERLAIEITSLEHDGTVIPVELEVYDTDGQPGIFIPNSMEMNAVREVAANMGGSLGSSINISTDAGAQIASDVGKGVIQGVSQYVEKKMRAVKITLKAGHRLLLHSPEK